MYSPVTRAATRIARTILPVSIRRPFGRFVYRTNLFWLSSIFKQSVEKKYAGIAADTGIPFMNLGYYDQELQKQLHLKNDDEPWRYNIQLYHHLAAGIDLTNKNILEIGCGNGGGCYYLANYHSPQNVVGMDLSSDNVEFCRKKHGNYALFIKGDAERISRHLTADVPGSYDVVFNIESSHHYPNIDRFFSEVAKVLVSNGIFCYAGFSTLDTLDKNEDLIKKVGFTIARKNNITTHVLESLNRDKKRKEEFLSTSREYSYMLSFFAHPDSWEYNAFKSGAKEYRSYICTKN
ncbi:MAG: methyltransferase domain-containing protein [Chitinivibrionales bacterium]|nr:methyltransferase domain-containing protein [Chitinivibrionales bacterium]